MEHSGIIRSVTARLRRFVRDRRKLLRRVSRYKARLTFIVTPLDAAKLSRNRRPTAPALVGHTRDLSETSMTLLLPSVRVGNVYLTDSANYLEVRLELPSGHASILTNCVRFEQLPEKDAGCGYLLAVRIAEIEDAARARYLSYLTTLKESDRRTGRAQARHYPKAANERLFKAAKKL